MFFYSIKGLNLILKLKLSQHSHNSELASKVSIQYICSHGNSTPAGQMFAES